METVTFELGLKEQMGFWQVEMKRADETADIGWWVQRREKGSEGTDFRHVDGACEFQRPQGAGPKMTRGWGWQAEPAEGHGAHRKDSRYETPAFCHFQRQVHFIKRSLGDISCGCCALFCWKVDDKSLLPTASQHMAPPRPGHAWCHLLRLYPWGSAGKRIRLQCGRPGFNPCVGKIPWRRERLPTAVFWPGEFHGLCSPWGRKEWNATERLSQARYSCLSQPWPSPPSRRHCRQHRLLPPPKVWPLIISLCTNVGTHFGNMLISFILKVLFSCFEIGFIDMQLKEVSAIVIVYDLLFFNWVLI